jgi:hypothetical protein
MHFAVDTNVAPGEVSLAVAYLRGCSDGGGQGPQSGYGETSVIDAAYNLGVTRNAWRAAALSWDSAASKRATMQQTTQRSYPYPGAYDENIILAPDWGQHPYTGDEMATPFTLWQDVSTSPATVWRVDAAGQSKVRVPDLQQIAWNFDRLKEYGDPNPAVRDAVGEGKRWLDAIPAAGAVVLPPLPPYPVPPTAAENGAAAAAAVKPLLNSQKITVP